MPRWIALAILLCLASLGGTAIAGGGGGVPPPVLAKTVDVAPISGKVLVRTKGTKRFRVLRSAASIPVGSSIDTTNGHVALTSATKAGGFQSTEFFDGRFGVGQRRSG